MRTVCIVQARMNATRLPGKLLLDLAGKTSLERVLERCMAITGVDVVCCATTDGAECDALAVVAKKAGAAVFRGSEDDVLRRYHEAAISLNADVILRVTADCPLIDPAICTDVLLLRQNSGADYANNNERPLWPYGLDCEAVTFAWLDRAAREATLPSDREHVTRFIRQHPEARKVTLKGPGKGYQHYSWALDTEDDLIFLRALFKRMPDNPESWNYQVPLFLVEADPQLAAINGHQDRHASLARSLAVDAAAGHFRLPSQVVCGRRHAELVLGTVQLGMPYGSARLRPMPSAKDSAKIVRRAVAQGVTHIDSARAYCNSEVRIGAAFSDGWPPHVQIVTKLSNLDELPPDASHDTVRSLVDESIKQSKAALGLTSISTLLLHNVRLLRAWDGAAWQRLREHEADGSIGIVGASVNSPKEARLALAEEHIRHLQLPYNIMDHRWDDADFQKAVRSRSDMVVHARSALLQGILADKDPSAWPIIDGLNVSSLMAWLDMEYQRLDRKGIADLCFAYVRAQTWIHGVVVGMETMQQLSDNIELFVASPLERPDCEALRARRPLVPDDLLVPGRWNKP